MREAILLRLEVLDKQIKIEFKLATLGLQDKIIINYIKSANREYKDNKFIKAKELAYNNDN